MSSGDSMRTAITDFQTALTIAQNQVKAGITTLADVYSAQTELESTQAADVSVELTRAKFEHAIAVLIGKDPEELAIDQWPASPRSCRSCPPACLPTLLQRRPDIAAAERSVASANALIGVAQAAWFPSLTLIGLVRLHLHRAARTVQRRQFAVVVRSGAGRDGIQWRRAPGTNRAGAGQLR